MARGTYKNGPRPLCYDADRYFVTPIDYDKKPLRCIAPTGANERCSWTITKEELSRAKYAELKARQCQLEEERIEELEFVVLARCCGDWHRERIEKEASCLSLIALTYQRAISNRRMLAITPPQRRTEAPRSETSPSLSPPRLDWCGNVRRQYNLRPRDPNTGRVPPRLSKPGILQPMFTQYDSTADRSIFEIFSQRVPNDYVASGSIYAFSWPSNPGFVKIGYSRDVESRIFEWQSCNPGASLIIQRKVEYPKRIEELIHAQLRCQRRQIIICAGCSRMHWEWFEISIDVARQTLQEWVTLIQREALYSPGRTLTSEWHKRIAAPEVEITARSLLDVLDVESKRLVQTQPKMKERTEQLKEAIRVTTVEILPPDSNKTVPEIESEVVRVEKAAEVREESRIYKEDLSDDSTSDWDELLVAFRSFMRLQDT